MDELSLSSAFLHELILKARAVMAAEGGVTPDEGGNPTDDETPATLQWDAANLTREELVEEIDALDETAQAELVALMWLGRGDDDPANWEAMTRLALERHVGSTSSYLLDHPLVADYWADGLDQLGYGTLLD